MPPGTMNGETSSAGRWDRRYSAAAEPPFGEAPNEYLRMIAARSDFAVRRVLSLADGDGRNGAWLAAQGCAVTAVDCSAVATERAVELDRRRGVAVTRIVADLAEWVPAPGDAWDAVFVIYLQGTRGLRLRALEVAAGALAPGGWLVVEGFSKAQAGRPDIGPDDPDRLYDLEELRAAASGLEVVEALAGRLRLDEGPRHRGEAEVVRFAARRPG
ncbi:class I SAM-dependent methyltransferase [Pelagibius sp. CAU 1746]|uniref:SAM-dependent methyltransferase n=1 Tax=Pelagibius sp. CAU 1746 TaxID=3140370 RepID=UPI00325BBAB3